MIGKTLAHYRITEKIGAGGMGDVYRAHDERLGRDVAVKVLHQHLATPEARARFEREARTVSQLSHPNICTLHDVGRQDDVDYLVMELVPGESLEPTRLRSWAPSCTRLQSDCGPGPVPCRARWPRSSRAAWRRHPPVVLRAPTSSPPP